MGRRRRTGGSLNGIDVIRGDVCRQLTRPPHFSLRRGDRVSSAPGAAVVGAILVRAIREAVARDVRDDLMTFAEAAASYGVVIDPATRRRTMRRRPGFGREPASESLAMIKIATDAGGTFTDLVAFDENSGKIYLGKALTTPKDPRRLIDSIIQGRETGLATPRRVLLRSRRHHRHQRHHRAKRRTHGDRNHPGLSRRHCDRPRQPPGPV